MTFAELVTAAKANVFPEGSPEELADRHRNVILDSLIELQRRVPCYRTNNTSVINSQDTYFNCGMSVFDAPRGHFHSLFTVLSSDFCDKVLYDPVSYDRMLQMSSDYEACETQYDPYGYYYEFDTYYPYDSLYYGDQYPTATQDRSCRSRQGYWTLHRDRIYVLPFILSTEQIILEWSGIKRTYADADEISWVDRDAQKAVEFYLEVEAYRHDDCDINKYRAALGHYTETMSDLIVECRKERRLPKPRDPVFSNCRLY